MKMLSRNAPIALVVGASGFIGSSLVDKLLSKRIQVIGVDNLSTGVHENLSDAAKNKNFLFFQQSIAEQLPSSIETIDYAFFVVNENQPKAKYLDLLESFLETVKDHHTKVLLVSSIENYDEENRVSEILLSAEKRLADFATGHKLNARIVRLAAVFGPRMHFREKDPLVRLILSAANDQLKNNIAPLDFTTRSLYIDDAVDLILKTVMHGSTSQKIYDGVLSFPIKVSEIKQILLDPLWHENKGFNPTHLPAWPTPNLLKTQKELNWTPSANLLSSLKNTLNYFQDHPEILEKAKQSTLNDIEKQPQQEVFQPESAQTSPVPKSSFWAKVLPKKSEDHLISLKNLVLLTIGLTIIGYALIFPLLTFGWGILTLRSNLQNSLQDAARGNFSKNTLQIAQIEQALSDLEVLQNYLNLLKETNYFKTERSDFEQGLALIDENAQATKNLLSGLESFYQVRKIMAGEEVGDLNETLNKSQSDFNEAVKYYSYLKAKLDQENQRNRFLTLLWPGQDSFAADIEYKRKIAQKSVLLTSLIKDFGSGESKKTYLVILLDNYHLRPGGGVVETVATISFNQGILDKIQTVSVEKLDAQLLEKIEPPADLKTDLNLFSWSLKESAIDQDFGENAQMAQWFYQKETGQKTAGVFALDLTAFANLLKTIGPIKTASSKEVIDGSNAGEKLSLSPELAAASLDELLQKLFFLTNQNWLEMITSFDQLANQKHSMIYLNNQDLLQTLSAAGWTGSVNAQTREKRGERREFISLSETNLSSSSALWKKDLKLKTIIDENGGVSHQLLIDFLPLGFDKKEIFAKKRLKIYLPSGSKVNKALLGSQDLTKDLTVFGDLGRIGYSLLLEISPTQDHLLSIEYQDAWPVTFDNQNLKYSLEVIKQPGSLADNFFYQLVLPTDLKTEKGSAFKQEGSNMTLNTDLDTDKFWEITLSRQ